MNEARRKPREPLTLQGAADRAEGALESATKLARTVGIGVVALLTVGGSLVYAVQEQIDGLKQRGRELQQDVTTSQTKAERAEAKAQDNRDKIEDLDAQVDATKAENDAQDTQIRDASTTAQVAKTKAEQPPTVIDRTKTVQASPRATPTPTPQPPGPLGLLFPPQKEIQQ